MIFKNEVAGKIAQCLLEISAVKLNPQDPFTWASGLRSPVYCDNRLTLSHPKIREFIKQSFKEIILNQFANVDIIAGVATAGIPHGVLVADSLNLPFIYVRSAPKVHGLENLIEGRLDAGKQVVVIEDLISTGGSSLKAVEAIRQAGGHVLGLCAIFTYGFTRAAKAFAEARCPVYTLSDYPTLIDQAIARAIVSDADKASLLQWYQEPEAWPGDGQPSKT